MGSEGHTGLLNAASSTLDPLPGNIRHWLQAVSALGLLSFIASFGLLSLLTYRLTRWQLKAKRTNQFTVIIFNLVLADLQQSIAFLLNLEWVRRNAVVVGTHTCWAQGWFVSTGDLASGVWCFAIGMHTFASVILNFKLPTRWFICAIIGLWLFIYAMALVGVGLHPHDIYVRAGAWCWVQGKFDQIRLWTHYIWIFFFEFGVIVIYGSIYIIMGRRIRTGYYSADEAQRAKSIANLMVAYPIVYVICTVPLASARMASMAGNTPSLAHLCLCAALITSNGWLDALLYTLTRRIMLFSDEPPEDNTGIDTFTTFWVERKSRFGAVTIIEATNQGGSRRRGRGGVKDHNRLPSRTGSQEDLFDAVDVKNIQAVTTTAVISEPADLADLREMPIDPRQKRPSESRRYSSESTGKSIELSQLSH